MDERWQKFTGLLDHRFSTLDLRIWFLSGNLDTRLDTRALNTVYKLIFFAPLCTYWSWCNCTNSFIDSTFCRLWFLPTKPNDTLFRSKDCRESIYALGSCSALQRRGSCRGDKRRFGWGAWLNPSRSCRSFRFGFAHHSLTTRPSVERTAEKALFSFGSRLALRCRGSYRWGSGWLCWGVWVKPIGPRSPHTKPKLAVLRLMVSHGWSIRSPTTDTPQGERDLGVWCKISQTPKDEGRKKVVV
jgi:hypothetical protein